MFKDYFMMLLSMIILFLMVLISVAFLTLLERKVLGYIQIRKGPNKVGYMGIIQPFSDAIKLFSKESIYPLKSNYFMYLISPVMNLFLGLILWLSMPFLSILINFNFNILFFLCCSSLMVYSVMIAGWSSNSIYAMLGSMRSIAQTISYEVSLILIMLSFLILILSVNLIDLMNFQYYLWFLFMSMPLSMVWLVSSLAETNRTPFDFAEGESELVSGFNVEYSGGGFAFIFLAEYSSILFMSMLSVMLFMGGNLFSWFFYFKLVLLSFIWIWVRGTLPRYRYDKLMFLTWKKFLPITLNYLMYFLGLKLLCMILNL